MESLHLPVLIVPSKYISGEFVSYTPYDLCGQGSSIQAAEDSAVSVVTDYLHVYAMRSKLLPEPVRLQSIDDITVHFGALVPRGVEIILDRTIATKFEGLPSMVFKFYRLCKYLN